MSDRIAGKKCFITGGAGFIGSHLAETLLKRGCTVTVYDNLATGKKNWLKKCMTDPKFKFIEADLLQLDNLESSIEDQDVVWHFGANTNMVIGRRNPEIDLTNGVIATYNVLNAMRKAKITELLFPSSGAIYGDILRPPASEDYGPLMPVSTYGAAKLSAEGWITCFSNLYAIRAWIFRFGNVLGERMGHGIIFDLLAKLRMNSEELEVLGDGTGEKNCFLVGECIDGMLYAHNHSDHRGCEIFNLGAESTTRVSDIVRIVLEESGHRETRIRYTGGERGWLGDQPRVYMSVEKMKKLGWSARHSSDEAVRIATRRYLAKENAS